MTIRYWLQADRGVLVDARSALVEAGELADDDELVAHLRSAAVLLDRKFGDAQAAQVQHAELAGADVAEVLFALAPAIELLVQHGAPTRRVQLAQQAADALRQADAAARERVAPTA